MGSYCDRCYTLCGSIETEHNTLETFDGWDCCPGCRNALHNIVNDNVKTFKKFNRIGGL